jgi:NADPH:quinone reductase-like Zn-dependent oxidoreductase
MDLAGLVEATGPGVEGVEKNAAIMARMDPMAAKGPLAEYVVLDAGCWVTCPGVDMDQAAGTLTTALTAYQSFKPYVKEGDKVFINGGGGGLGTAAIQIAKLMGCHVTVSCSTGKMDFCKELGADEVIDYKTEDVTAQLVSRGADKVVIMDNVGNSPTDLYRRCDKILKESGVYVFVGGRVSAGSVANLASSLLRPGWLGGQRRKFVMALTKTVEEEAKQIASWMGEGKYKTLVDSTYGFEEAKEAYDRLKTDQCRGKVIVHVAGQD